jgi:hypothetical protein
MAKASEKQRRTESRVMHEFKHGALKSGRGGKGGKVKSRKQAIALALNEAGSSVTLAGAGLLGMAISSRLNARSPPQVPRKARPRPGYPYISIA